MIYNIYHKTEFLYHTNVAFSHNIARLKPKDSYSQKLLDFSMEISPEVYETNEFVDMFGNNNLHMLIREPHSALSVIGKSKVEIFPDIAQKYIEMAKTNSLSYKESRDRLCAFHKDDIAAKQYLFETSLIPLGSDKIRMYVLESFSENRSLFEATQEFMQRIFNDFEFLSGFSDITTPVEEIFEAKKGVCQDFAQFAISALKSIGLPAKYMSGYIETLPAEGEKKLFGVDASHAWFSVYIPNVGWMDFDPTNNLIPTDQHILLGCGRDYNDISPLKGVVMSSGGSNLSVMVDVRKAPEREIATAKALQIQTQSQQ